MLVDPDNRGRLKEYLCARCIIGAGIICKAVKLAFAIVMVPDVKVFRRGFAVKIFALFYRL